MGFSPCSTKAIGSCVQLNYADILYSAAPPRPSVSLCRPTKSLVHSEHSEENGWRASGSAGKLTSSLLLLLLGFWSTHPIDSQRHIFSITEITILGSSRCSKAAERRFRSRSNEYPTVPFQLLKDTVYIALTSPGRRQEEWQRSHTARQSLLFYNLFWKKHHEATVPWLARS